MTATAYEGGVVYCSMEECVFCSITERKTPAWIIWENSDYVSFLDIFPNTRGQSLVIPKMHVTSYVFDSRDDEVAGIMKAAKLVAGKIEKALSVKRVNLVFEGLEVNHLHAKLYPAIGLKSTFERIVSDQTARYDRYSGFISTLHGPRAESGELDELRELIGSA